MQSESLTSRAHGQWSSVMRALAPHPDLLRAIDLFYQHPNKPRRWLTACPLHGGLSGRAFRVHRSFDGSGWSVCNTCRSLSGFEMLMRINAWDEKRTGRELGRFLDAMVIRPAPIAAVAAVSPADKELEGTPRKQLGEWWEQAVLLDHPAAEPARRFLISRGLGAVPALPSLRCHPALQWTERSSRRFPAVLAKFVNSRGRGVGLQRTFLTAAGVKAPIFEPRLSAKARGETLVGSVVQLMDAGAVLGIAEGIETALAVYLATGMPMWATTSTSLMRSVVIPAHVQCVVIWSDYDELSHRPDGTVVDPGSDAAEYLAARLRAQYRAVRILPANVLGRRAVDWNDVWVERGRAGFPLFDFRSLWPSARNLLRRSRSLRP